MTNLTNSKPRQRFTCWSLPTLNENARLYLAWDVLSFTEDAQGRYCWYMDDEGNEACIKVDSLEIIETSEYE